MTREGLIRKLNAIKGVQFAEYGWRTRPQGNFGTIKTQDFELDADNGDDRKQERAFEGSVDLFTVGEEWTIAAAVESVLEEECETCWELNSKQHGRETGLIHREYVFRYEGT